MITRHEFLFVEELVSALRCLNVEEIPFANQQFHDGVFELASFIISQTPHQHVIQEFDTLFIKRPISGTYDRIIEAFQGLNGKGISFPIHNPAYERAEIDIPVSLAQQILEESSSGLSKKFVLEAAYRFCKGAKIECTA